MIRVAVIGCGVVGATIAYELSQVPGLDVAVFDRHPPAQGATGAALGVLMGAISKKVKGRAWRLRETSIKRYETLIPELEANTGRHVPYNRQGILMLCFTPEDFASWDSLLETRQSQGWRLERWDVSQVRSHCPQLNCDRIIGAIYSPQDRQVDPTALTQALVAAAGDNGVTFHFGASVQNTRSQPDTPTRQTCHQIQTATQAFDVDWLVVAAGLGSFPLTASLAQPIPIKPVLGQALHLRLEQPLGNPNFQPVITGDDVHIVPVGQGEYWVGATVEFPNEQGDVVADSTLLEQVKRDAIAFCPPLANATILRTWTGKRPRPEGRPAPVIGQLPGYSNVLLATGHYRNGVLLAPATAFAIRDVIM